MIAGFRGEVLAEVVDAQAVVEAGLAEEARVLGDACECAGDVRKHLSRRT